MDKNSLSNPGDQIINLNFGKWTTHQPIPKIKWSKAIWYIEFPFNIFPTFSRLSLIELTIKRFQLILHNDKSVIFCLAVSYNNIFNFLFLFFYSVMTLGEP